MWLIHKIIKKQNLMIADRINKQHVHIQLYLIEEYQLKSKQSTPCECYRQTREGLAATEGRLNKLNLI